MIFLNFCQDLLLPTETIQHDISAADLVQKPIGLVCEDIEQIQSLVGKHRDRVSAVALVKNLKTPLSLGKTFHCYPLALFCNSKPQKILDFLNFQTNLLVQASLLESDKKLREFELKKAKKVANTLRQEYESLSEIVRKETEEKLEEKDYLIDLTQRLGKIGAFEINLFKRETVCTPYLLEMLNLASFDPIADKQFEKALEIVKKGKFEHEFEWQLDCSDKMTRYFLVNLRRDHVSHKGELTIVRGSIKDITHLKTLQLEAELQKAKSIHSSKLAALGEMAGGIAHEINNPLTIIAGNTAMLKKYHEMNALTPEVLFKSLTSIESTLARIEKIVRGLRTLSRDTGEIDTTSVKLDDILEDVLGLCNERFNNNGIFFKLNIENHDKDQLIWCDRVQISQVLLNLLNNSFYAVKNVDEKWITLDIIKEAKVWIFKVTDSGNEISPEVKEKIFTPFFTSKPVGEGTGLGLSLSRTIIKNHKGSINIDRNSENTCFYFSLPVKDQAVAL